MRPALGARDFLELSLAFQPRPHIVHERLGTEQHLTLKFKPGRRQVLALSDEFGIAPLRDRPGLGELTEEPVRVEPSA